MSSWGAENYMMQNMMGMPPMIPNFPHPMQNMMPGPMSNMMGQIPMTPMPEFPVNEPPPSTEPSNAPLIGPIIPENFKTNDILMDNKDQSANDMKSSRNSRDNRNDRRDRDKRYRSRSQDRHRHDRGDRDRNKSDKGRGGRRDRHTKWDSNVEGNTEAPTMPMGNMMMPGNGMGYGQTFGQMNNMMGQPTMDMPSNIPPNMPSNMPPNMANMQPNMAHNMMVPDQNLMMMMNQQVPMMGLQAIFVTNAMLLPPIPGAAIMSRREKPNGCKTIFIGGLPNEIGDDAIKEIFQRFGHIDSVKVHNQGVYHVRFEDASSVEPAFFLAGYRFKYHDQTENEATTIFIDYALNRDDQNEYENNRRRRAATPPHIEPYSPSALNNIVDKVKSDTDFADAAHTLAVWLVRGECNKKNASTFYSLIQASNNQIRRLFTEKMAIDEEFQTIKATFREKFARILMQFEQVAKILSAARHQRVSDHFSKQQRRNIEMWLKMTEEVGNIRDEFNSMFDEEETEKVSKNVIRLEKYEELKMEKENLIYELEGYRNEAHLAKDEAERKFEKFKAHFIAQQALQNNKIYSPMPPPPMPTLITDVHPKPPPTEDKYSPPLPPSDAKLISIITGFLMVHPLGATLDYLVSYVRSLVPHSSQLAVQEVLQKYDDVFRRTTTGVGATIEHRWGFVAYDVIKHQLL